ncbi:MAG: MarR family transcriptional regulator, partial [Planctomycetota bacterium]
MSLQVLDLVAQLLAVGAEGASVTELCQRTGIPRPTMSGQLARLQAGGWVERVARGSYRAGPVALQRFAGGVGSLPGQRGTLVLAAHPDEEVLLIYEGFRALVEGQGFRAQLRSLPPEPPPDWDAVQLEALLPVAEPVRGLAFYADATIGGGFLEALLQRRLPAVALGQTDHQAIDTVTIDVAHGSRAVVDALVAAGRRRIVYLHDP